MQIIFDPSQEDGNGEIWLDLFSLSKFLSTERAKVIKDATKKEWVSATLKTPTLSKTEQLKELEKDLVVR